MRDVEFAPLSGAPARLAAVASSAARAAAVLDDARGRVLGVRGVVDGQRSRAVTAARELLSDVAFRLGTCAGVLSGASAALREHAGALAEQQQVAQLALARRAEALDRERRARAELEEVHRSTWNAFAPDYAVAAFRISAAERMVADARADVLASEVQWRRARDAKAAESARATAIIGALGDVRMVTAGVATGLSAAQLAASWERGLYAAALVPTAAWTRDVTDRAAASAELRRLLSAASDDPAFWTAFWGQATPADLYPALGLDPVGETLAASLSAGTRAWAATASTEELETFGRGVVEDLGDSLLGLDERAALAGLLLAPTLPGTVHRGAAEALVERRTARPGDPVDVLALAPVTSAVATGLMLHPREAFEHLAPADPALAAERAHVWFGVAPPDGWPDGGEAVAGALAAAVLVGSQSSRGNQTRATLLASHATLELPRGLLAVPPPSDLASRRIARAYEPYVPVFGDTVLSSKTDTPPRRPDVRGDFQLAEGVAEDLPVVVQPDLDAFALRDVIAATSQTETAGSAWLGAAERYHDAMLDLAFGTSAPDGIDEGDRTDIVQASQRDAGAVAGAVQAETLRAARRSQATAEGAASAAAFLGSVAVSAASLSPVASTSVSTAGATLIGLLVEDELGPARVEILAEEPELREHFAAASRDAALRHDEQRGIPRDDAITERGKLAADSDDTKINFGETYNQMSGLERRLGENP